MEFRTKYLEDSTQPLKHVPVRRGEKAVLLLACCHAFLLALQALVQLINPLIDGLVHQLTNIFEAKCPTHWFELDSSLDLGIPGIPANWHPTHQNKMFVLVFANLTYKTPHPFAPWL